MGRAPCCDKAVKKGPWTPEEDIALVSYIQEHGPGNWRNVPSHTGLMRCSKSCRLRWTNYLRPGIKRGNFTPYEDRMIVHLQALLGNRWAAIASYLPQRTDNDIKNYWNTHLKKRLKKMQMHSSSSDNDFELLKQSTSTATPKGQWESRLQTDIHHAKQALFEALNMSNPTYTTTPLVTQSVSPVMGSPYAASLENLTRLLEGWKQTQPSSSKDAMNFPSSASTSTCSETSGDAVANDVQIGVAPSKGTCMEEGNFTWASPFNSSSFNSSSCDDIASINDLESSYKKNMNNIEAAVAMEEGEVPLNMLEKWLMMEESMQNQNQNQNQNQSYQDQLGINSNTASTELQYPYMVESDIKNELCVTPD